MRPLPLPNASPPINTTTTNKFTLTVPKRTARLRMIGLIYGAILLVWSSLEDNTMLPVAILGSGLAILSMAFWITGNYGGRVFERRPALLAAALVGAAAGVAAALLTTLLMLIKTGLHSHVFPDYPFGMMVEVLQNSPLWALAGIFAGIGLLLAWWAIGLSRKNEQDSTTEDAASLRANAEENQ